MVLRNKNEVEMYKPAVQYKIESCPSNDKDALEKLLNQMCAAGWDLYSMNEVEVDGDFCYNCIFVKEADEFDEDEDDLSDIIGFKSKIERIMNTKNEPYEQCSEIQRKIKEKRTKISKIKSLIDSTSENQRSKLNEEISRLLNDLLELQQSLREIISPDIMIPRIGEDKLSISLSEEIIDLVNPDLEANLVAQTVRARQNLTEELGYVIPRVKFQDDDSIQANEYCVNVRGIPAFKARVYLGHLMFYKEELKLSKLPATAITDIDEYSDEEVVWIPIEKTKDFWLKGKTPSEVIAENLKLTCIKYIEDLFDYTDVNCYVEIVGMQNSYLVENIIPDFLSVAEIKFILTSLIKEQISIKDIIYVFEKINDFADEATKEDLLDKIRIAFKRQISAKLANENGVIQAFELTDNNREYFEDAILQEYEDEEDDDDIDEDVQKIAIEEKKVINIIKNIKKMCKKYSIDSKNTVLIVPYRIRYVLSILLGQFLPNIKIIAKEEISSEYTLELLEQI